MKTKYFIAAVVAFISFGVSAATGHNTLAVVCAVVAVWISIYFWKRRKE